MRRLDAAHHLGRRGDRAPVGQVRDGKGDLARALFGRRDGDSERFRQLLREVGLERRQLHKLLRLPELRRCVVGREEPVPRVDLLLLALRFVSDVSPHPRSDRLVAVLERLRQDAVGSGRLETSLSDVRRPKVFEALPDVPDAFFHKERVVCAHPVLPQADRGVCRGELAVINELVGGVPDPDGRRRMAGVAGHPRLERVTRAEGALLGAGLYAGGDAHPVRVEVEPEVIVGSSTAPDDEAGCAVGHDRVEEPDGASIDDLDLGGLRLGVEHAAVLVADFEDDDGVELAGAGDADVAPLKLELLFEGKVVVGAGIEGGALEVLDVCVPGEVRRADHLPHVGDGGVHIGHVDGANVGAAGRNGGPVLDIGVSPEGWVEFIFIT